MAVETKEPFTFLITWCQKTGDNLKQKLLTETKVESLSYFWSTCSQHKFELTCSYLWEKTHRKYLLLLLLKTLHCCCCRVASTETPPKATASCHFKGVLWAFHLILVTSFLVVFGNKVTKLSCNNCLFFILCLANRKHHTQNYAT